jgi:signal transduction histidine kinase
MTERLAVTVRTWSRTPVLQDAVLASGLLAACVVVNSSTTIVSRQAGDAIARTPGGDLVLWWAATALVVVGVALRRRLPLPMLAVCTVAAAMHMAQAIPLMIIDLGGVLILLGTVAVRHGRAISLPALAGLLLLVTGWSLYFVANDLPAPGLPTLIPTAGPDRRADAFVSHPDAWSGLFVLGSILVAAWAIGSGARSRRAYLDELHARAHDLERERNQQAAFAIASERGRISRELHDVVAHGLSVMVTQAQGAAAALDNRPADTRAALGRSSRPDAARSPTCAGSCPGWTGWTTRGTRSPGSTNCPPWSPR